MARPPLENRRCVADATLTLRLTQEDRELLHELVARKAAENIDTGMEVTAASFVRGLIRHEAREQGLLRTVPRKKRSAARGSSRVLSATAATGSQTEGRRAS